MKKFEIPEKYKSSIIGNIKEIRKIHDPRKKNYYPTELDFGPVRFFIARHFGFCYGVENAIEIAYKTVEENPDKRIFLLSEMIHNPGVNEDLQNKGIRFIMDTYENQLIDWSELKSDDIVIIPAFGTTLEIEQKLQEVGIDTKQYDTTCPFVEKVWNRSASIGKKGYSVIIHGKAKHEETRATFSHSAKGTPSVVVKNLEETKYLAKVIKREVSPDKFYEFFDGKYSEGFDVRKDLDKIGVVNQTTMLASETQEIADYLKQTIIEKFGEENYKEHFADTRDTLCYATNDNQNATYKLLEQEADLAVVVGGYNSSNTSHIVELCEEQFPTYFISDEDKILSDKLISHFDIHSQQEKVTENFIPRKDKVNIALTSGASCPDSVIDEVLNKFLSLFDNTRHVDEVISELKEKK